MNQQVISTKRSQSLIAMGMTLFAVGLVAGPSMAAGADPAEIAKLQNKLRIEYRASDYKAALKTAEELHELEPDNADTAYNIACLHCLMGEKDKAYEWLEKSVKTGYRDADQLMQDSDFRTIRGEDRFRKIVSGLREDGDDDADGDEKPASKDESKPKKEAETNEKDDKDLSPQERQMQIGQLTRELIQAAESKDYEKALKIAIKAEKLAEKLSPAAKALTSYNVACMQSLNKHKEEAIEAFARAVHSGGFTDDLVGQIKDDHDLDFIRSDPRFAKMVEHLTKTTAKKVDAATKVTLPKKFDKSKPAPLIVALHPWGGNMDETRDQWQKVADKFGAILLTPQGTYKLGDDEYRWDMDLDVLEDQVMQAVESVMDQYKVDDDKVVLAGFSQGGWAAYAIGLRNPGTIHGVITIAGRFDKAFEAEADGGDLDGMRFVIITGDKDDEEMLKSSHLAEKVLKKSGAKVQYKSFKGLGHAYPKDAEKELSAAVEFALE